MSHEETAHQDPMSADRRTMAIALVAMMVFVAVGVVSAAVFTRSACGQIVPDPISTPTAGSNLPDVVSQAFGELDEVARGAVEEAVSSLAEELGPVIGVADADGAERLAVVGSAVGALGPTSLVLEPGGAEARAAADLSDPAVVVGDGRTLYSVALANELTGQLDAIQPIDVDLEPVGSCLDAATVNVPFAFHLDARGGELLLFRADEDAGDPELELRERAGSAWTVPIEIVIAPPGLLGERFTGRIGEELVVASRRVVPGETAAAVTAVGRNDGEIRWVLSPGDLPELGDEVVWIEVVAVSEEIVIVAVADDAARDDRRLVGLDAQDGSVVWADPGPSRVIDVLLVGTEVTELVRDGERVLIRELEAGSADRQVVAGEPAEDGRLIGLPDGRRAAALGDAGLVVIDGGDATTLGVGAAVEDIEVDDEGRVAVLLSVGPQAIVVTFGA